MVDKVKLVKYILLFTFVFGGWAIWFSGLLGNNGWLQAYQLTKYKRELVLRNRALENEKARLRATLDAMNQDPVAQERAIRETLGYVRDHELTFEFH